MVCLGFKPGRMEGTDESTELRRHPLSKIVFDNGSGWRENILFSIGGGELFDRVIEDEFVLTERACAAFMRQIVEAVAYIHQQHIIHLDLKVRNIYTSFCVEL